MNQADQPQAGKLTPQALRAWLKAHDFTRPEFASTIGVSLRALEDWCSGRRTIPGWLQVMLGLMDQLRIRGAGDRRRAVIRRKSQVGRSGKI